MPDSLALETAILACYAYWSTERSVPDDERVVCCSWADRIHRAEHGRPLHNGQLRRLARLGLLAQADSSRGGRRRYYRFTDSGLAEARRILGHHDATRRKDIDGR